MFAFSQSSGSIPVSIDLWKIDVTAGGIGMLLLETLA
jgi:hypothetical protein